MLKKFESAVKTPKKLLWLQIRHETDFYFSKIQTFHKVRRRSLIRMVQFGP